MDRRLCFTICGVTVAATGIWLIKKWLAGSKVAPRNSVKLIGVENWIRINHLKLTEFSVEILQSIGCDENIAKIVGEHLVESNLQSIDSHGVVRLEQYAEQGHKGLFNPKYSYSTLGTVLYNWHVSLN